MSNRLKQITTKAKALYKTGKFAKWTDAIKAASKQTKTAKKKIGAVKKKAAPKKKSSKVSSHKDTKSHNVNIKVVSGTNELKKLVYYHVPTKLSNEYEELKKGETNLANFIFLSKLKNLTKEQKKEVIKQIKYWKSHVKATKNNILILKKHL